MWKHVLQPGRSQTTIWRMRIARWVPKSTNTHSELSNTFGCTIMTQSYVLQTFCLVIFKFKSFFGLIFTSQRTQSVSFISANNHEIISVKVFIWDSFIYLQFFLLECLEKFDFKSLMWKFTKNRRVSVMCSCADRRRKIKSEITKLRVTLHMFPANTPKMDAYKISLEKSHCIGQGWRDMRSKLMWNLEV
jgi:hypothetical protein